MDWNLDSEYDSDFDGSTYDAPPSEVESGGFTYSKAQGLQYKGHHPKPVAKLRLIYRKNARAASRLNKPEIMAQLRLYDIPFKSSAKVDEIKATLKAALDAGKCNKLPPATVAKETALREKLEQQRAPYECRKEQKQDEIFARLSSPSDQANFDVPRFVAKYFLTGPQGQPDPKKTPNPLHLSGSLAPAAEAALQEAANSISGLHVAYTRTERRFLDDHSVVIGWGIKKVSALVRKLEAEEAEAERKREAEEEAQKGAWQEEGMEIFLQSHRDYAKRHRPPTGALKLEHLTGSYIVECARLGDYSSRYGHSMSLDIHAPSSSLGCEAAFNFAMVEGTMLLGLSEDSVEQFREETEEAGKWSEDEWKDPADDDEEEDEEATYGNPGSSAAVAKRKATGQPTSSKPTIIKRRLGETPRPNRVYFQWRGRETGLREIQCGRLGNHVGHLDFSSSGLTAHGVFVHPNFFGDERVEFKIYKADEKPHSEPEAWSDMSERGWDYERVARWH